MLKRGRDGMYVVSKGILHEMMETPRCRSYWRPAQSMRAGARTACLICTSLSDAMCFRRSVNGQQRKKLDDENKLRNFVQKWVRLREKKALRRWRFWWRRRLRLRQIIVPAAKRFYAENTRICMFAFKIAAVQVLRTLDPARVARAHLWQGALARRAHALGPCASAQRWWRGRLGFILLLRRAKEDDGDRAAARRSRMAGPPPGGAAAHGSPEARRIKRERRWRSCTGIMLGRW